MQVQGVTDPHTVCIIFSLFDHLPLLPFHTVFPIVILQFSDFLIFYFDCFQNSCLPRYATLYLNRWLQLVFDILLFFLRDGLHLPLRIARKLDNTSLFRTFHKWMIHVQTSLSKSIWPNTCTNLSCIISKPRQNVDHHVENLSSSSFWTILEEKVHHSCFIKLTHAITLIYTFLS